MGERGNDILIGGTTQYDSDHKALPEILEELNRSDLEYNERIKRQSIGTYGLNHSIVVNDNAKDQITSGAKFDWYFTDETDKLTYNLSWEIVVGQSANDGAKKC